MGKGTITEERPQAESPTEVGAPTCRHHWLIDSPRGALSMGRCKVCGEEREFRNSATDHVWEDDSSSSGYGKWGGIRSKPTAADDDDVAASPRSGGREPAMVL